MRGNPEASHKTLKEHPPYVGKPGPPKRLKNGHRQTRKSPRPLKEKWKATAQGEFEERQKDLKKRAVRLIPDLRALLRAHEQALVLLSLLLPRARWAHGGSTTGIIHHVPAVTFAVLFASFARSFVTIFEATKLAQNLRRACVQPLNRNAAALQHRSGNGRWETTARGVRALQGRADFFGRSSVVYQGGDQDLSCQCVCEFGNDCVAALASSYSGMTAWMAALAQWLLFAATARCASSSQSAGAAVDGQGWPCLCDALVSNASPAFALLGAPMARRSDRMNCSLRQSNRSTVRVIDIRTLPGRLELPTLRLTASRSNQLS